ncbi:MAG: sulfatase-like hydrolase/transferase [Muribaculaceae bacterium]
MKHSNRIIRLLRRMWCNQQCLFALCVFALLLPNFLLFFTEPTSLPVRICNIVLPLGIWWYAMTLLKRPGKMFWILFLFIFFNAFQIVLLDMYGEAILAVDMFLNVATTNPTEAGEQLGGILPAVLFVVIVYVPLLLWSVVSIYHPGVSKRFIKRQRRCALATLAAGFCMLITCYITEARFSFINDIYPANVCDNLVIAVQRTIATNRYTVTSQHFTFNAKATHQPSEKEAYILVIGETARADNFGVYGYHRNTTPHLSAEQNLVAFTDVLSQANVTHKSVPMIMSAVSAENFDSIYQQKSVITAFREAGFSTAFFSNQRYNRSFIDYFAREAHRNVFVKQNTPADANIDDSCLIDYLQDELTNNASTHQLVVLHTYGSHFNYSDRYPKDARIFTPDRITTIGYKNRQTMINAYDNSIVYTDMLLHRIINVANQTGYNACVIYLSDHGEDIYDDERHLYMHASPVPSYYQLHVPLLVWTNDAYAQAHPQMVQALRANVHKPVASNLVVFHTLMHMAGISTPYAKEQFSLSSANYNPPKRYYLNDHNDALPLNQIGLKQQDVEMLRSQHMQYP